MHGLRVVELAMWVGGPAVGGILADWGADVVKIEPPAGDPFRAFFRVTGYGESGPECDRAAYDLGAYWSRAGADARGGGRRPASGGSRRRPCHAARLDLSRMPLPQRSRLLRIIWMCFIAAV